MSRRLTNREVLAINSAREEEGQSFENFCEACSTEELDMSLYLHANPYYRKEMPSELLTKLVGFEATAKAVQAHTPDWVEPAASKIFARPADSEQELNTSNMGSRIYYPTPPYSFGDAVDYLEANLREMTKDIGPRNTEEAALIALRRVLSK